MSAYVVIELTVKDVAARDRYSAAVGPILQEYGGEFVARGAWTPLLGEAAMAGGAIIRFEDREHALAWFGSAAYQATIADRDAGMNSTFKLIG